MQFQVLDSNKYPLKVENDNSQLTFWRFEHRATVGRNCREYIVFVDHAPGGIIPTGPTCHIEEITGGHLERIEDENLAKALQIFCMEQGFLNVGPPILRILG